HVRVESLAAVRKPGHVRTRRIHRMDRDLLTDGLLLAELLERGLPLVATSDLVPHHEPCADDGRDRLHLPRHSVGAVVEGPAEVHDSFRRGVAGDAPQRRALGAGVWRAGVGWASADWTGVGS